MADEIMGTAVFVKRADDGRGRLWVCCAMEGGPRKGQRMLVTIDVAPYETRGDAWGYEVQGTRLRVRPSLRVTWPKWDEAAQKPGAEMEELFHNGADRDGGVRGVAGGCGGVGVVPSTES